MQNIKTSDRRNLPDQARRALFQKFEVHRVLYKAVCRDMSLPSELRERFRYRLTMLPRDSCPTRVRNRCAYSGRPRGVLRRFRMSRIVLRELALQGLVNGLKRALG